MTVSVGEQSKIKAGQKMEHCGTISENLVKVTKTKYMILI